MIDILSNSASISAGEPPTLEWDESHLVKQGTTSFQCQHAHHPKFEQVSAPRCPAIIFIAAPEKLQKFALNHIRSYYSVAEKFKKIDLGVLHSNVNECAWYCNQFLIESELCKLSIMVCWRPWPWQCTVFLKITDFKLESCLVPNCEVANF